MLTNLKKKFNFDIIWNIVGITYLFLVFRSSAIFCNHKVLARRSSVLKLEVSKISYFISSKTFKNICIIQTKHQFVRSFTQYQFIQLMQLRY